MWSNELARKASDFAFNASTRIPALPKCVIDVDLNDKLVRTIWSDSKYTSLFFEHSEEKPLYFYLDTRDGYDDGEVESDEHALALLRKYFVECDVED